MNTVATVLVKDFFLRFGLPKIIHSDQGPEFMSELMREVWKLMEITPTRNTPYHSRSNGLVERVQSTIQTMLKSYIAENRQNWDKILPFILSAFRSSEIL